MPESRKKPLNMKVTVIPIVVSALGIIPKDLEKLKRKGRDNPDHSIVKIGLNTENSPGDLRRLAVTQILM